ncbi:cell cycle control protein, Cwf22 [Pseudohyphozyma bogoriensis]|nr:cell cycle control protein, Cwf22 [Pseudohyphozyma bogoriensis]
MADIEPVVSFMKKKGKRPGGLRKRPLEDEASTSAAADNEPSTSEVVIATRKQAVNHLIQGTGPKRRKQGDVDADAMLSDSDDEEKDKGLVRHSASVVRPRRRSSSPPAEMSAESIKESQKNKFEKEEEAKDDGMYHGVKGQQHKLPKAFGPVKGGPGNVRTITLVDYQPDVCKDYKETGFCGFGDTCKFLHDRGDYLHGWQLDNQFLSSSAAAGSFMAKQAAREGGGADDDDSDSDNEDLPFACLICRNPFGKEPVVTLCGHYFDSACAIKRFSKTGKCFACGKGTNGVFNNLTMSVSPRPGDSPDLKRKRSEDSRSPSPPARRARAASPGSDVAVPRLADADPDRRRERERQLAADAATTGDDAPIIKPKIDLRDEMKKMANTRGGGAYIPPHRLRAMMADAEEQDQEGAEYQRLSWEALRKSINGLINKVNVSNIKLIVPELFGENLIRGRGLFVRSIMRAQASSLPFTPIFASLVAIVNTKLPMVGELLLTRLIIQFRRSYKRNDKPTMTATTTFLAQLVNQQVAHEIVALQILVLLLEKPTDDSVEIAVSFMKEVGAFLAETSPKANNGVYERFRAILHESGIDKRVQYMVEVLFQVRKDKYKDNPVIPEGLDLVEEEDAITHKVQLDDELKVEEMLNVFKFDPKYAENEEKYLEMKREILGDSDEEEESGESGDEEDDEDSEEEPDDGIKADGTVDVHDHTGANVVNLRRTIYLTIMSALDFEEAVHKLLKIPIGDGQEGEMCNMIIECCSQERTYSKFFGLMGERFCKLNQVWTMAYEQCFQTYYNTIHRYETNRLRNIARFFGHLLSTDAVSWTVFDAVKMNEDDTTSSSRIFIKIMFQEMTEGMGLKKLAERFKDESLRMYLSNIFPVDNPKNTRFSINFFTSIGLGAVTEDMREHLKRAPAIMMAQRAQLEADSSDSDSSSSLSSSSLSDASGSSGSYGGAPGASAGGMEGKRSAGVSTGEEDDQEKAKRARQALSCNTMSGVYQAKAARELFALASDMRKLANRLAIVEKFLQSLPPETTKNLPSMGDPGYSISLSTEASPAQEAGTSPGDQLEDDTELATVALESLALLPGGSYNSVLTPLHPSGAYEAHSPSHDSASPSNTVLSELTTAFTSILARPLNIDNDYAASRLGLPFGTPKDEIPLAHFREMQRIYAVLPTKELTLVLLNRYYEELGDWQAVPQFRSISTVVLIMQYAHMARMGGGQMSLYFGLMAGGCRIAQLMGLHKLGEDLKTMPPDDPAFPPGCNSVKRQTAIRGFNSLLFLDWLTIPRLGCYLFHDSQITTGHLANVNDADLSPTDWYLSPYPPNIVTDCSFENAKRLGAVQTRKVFDKLLSPGANFTYAAVLEMDQGYRKILDELPDFWKTEHQAIEIKYPKMRRIRFITLEGVHSRIMRLHRPFLMRGYQPGSPVRFSTEQCVASARIVVVAIHNILEATAGLFFTYVHALSASLVLLADLFHAIDHDFMEHDIDSKKILSDMADERRATRAAQRTSSGIIATPEPFAQVLSRVSNQFGVDQNGELTEPTTTAPPPPAPESSRDAQQSTTSDDNFSAQFFRDLGLPQEGIDYWSAAQVPPGAEAQPDLSLLSGGMEWMGASMGSMGIGVDGSGMAGSGLANQPYYSW